MVYLLGCFILYAYLYALRDPETRNTFFQALGVPPHPFFTYFDTYPILRICMKEDRGLLYTAFTNPVSTRSTPAHNAHTAHNASPIFHRKM